MRTFDQVSVQIDGAKQGAGKADPRLEVRARCKLCRAAGEWFTVKADRVDNDIKKRRARDNLFERSAQHDPQG